MLVRLDHQCGPAIDRPGNNPDFPPVRARIGVNRRIRPDIGEIETSGEDRFHGARTGVVDIPFHVDALSEPWRKPAGVVPFEVPGNQGLNMRDVREVTDPDRELLPQCRRDFDAQQAHSDKQAATPAGTHSRGSDSRLHRVTTPSAAAAPTNSMTEKSCPVEGTAGARRSVPYSSARLTSPAGSPIQAKVACSARPPLRASRAVPGRRRNAWRRGQSSSGRPSRSPP